MLALLADVNATDQVAIPASWWTLVALIIPVLVAIVAKYRESSSAVHAVIAIVASGLVAVLQMLIDDIPQDTFLSVLNTFLGIVIPAIAAYVGFWKPVVNINQKLGPDKGI